MNFTLHDDVHEFDNGLRIHARHFAKAGESYEAELEDTFRWLIAAIAEGGCFVNCGSSIGFYPLLAKRYSPRIRVHAFEPLALHRAYFAENAELNGLRPSDYFLHDEGVSRADGRVEFHQNRFGSTIIDKHATTLKHRLKLVRLKYRRWLQHLGLKNYELAIASIPVVSLPTVVQRAGGTIDCLQMDIQGSELDVLRGGLSCLKAGAIKSLLISTHGAALHVRCAKLLKSCGYSIELDKPRNRSDGTLVASLGGRRLPIHAEIDPLRRAS